MTDSHGLDAAALDAASQEYLRVFATHREALVAAIHAYLTARDRQKGPERTPPLDLRAIGREADVTRTMPPDVQYGGPWQEAALRHAETIDRLLVHCRALRAALEPFAGMYDPSDRDVERMADKCPVQWQYDMYGTQGLTLGDLKRAAAVLAAAQDGEAGP